MKRKGYYAALAGIAAVCAAMVLLRIGLASFAWSVMAFPMAPIGMGLRKLSLSGSAGNIAAIVIYILLSLLPLGYLLFCSRRRALTASDGLLAVLSVLLFAVLYVMINPGLIGELLGTHMLMETGKAMLGGMVWSVVVGYLVLQILRLFF